MALASSFTNVPRSSVASRKGRFCASSHGWRVFLLHGSKEGLHLYESLIY